MKTETLSTLTAHTPGPWQSWQPGGDFGSKWLVSRRGVSSVCTVHNHGLQAEQPEADANARLIAAAPDLLAALQATERVWFESKNGTGGEANEVRALIRAALARVNA